LLDVYDSNRDIDDMLSVRHGTAREPFWGVQLVSMLDWKRIGVSGQRLRGYQYRTGGKRSRDLTGPFRIIAGQQDLHLLVSLLHMREAEAKPMPHRGTAVLAR
jgi:hypothetical protein